MTNNELTLDQLTSISGGGKEEREERRAERKLLVLKRNARKLLRKDLGKMAHGFIPVFPVLMAPARFCTQTCEFLLN